MNSWVLVVTTWMIINGQPANVSVDPVRYFKAQPACEKARDRATAVPVPVGLGYKVECVFNGA